MVYRRLPAAFALLIVLHLLGIREGDAQGVNSRSPIVEQLNAANPLAQLRERASLIQQSSAIALEGAVEPDAYVVGPGDVFTYSINSSPPVSSIASVGADGYLVIPIVGRSHVAGRTLTAAYDTIDETVRQRFANVAVDISLDNPRQFFVHVTGAVPLPGKYLVSGVSRVEDAVLQAYSKKAYDLEVVRTRQDPQIAEEVERALPLPSSERPMMSEGYRPSLRTIRVDHRDSSTSSADLLMYYATGDKQYNPHLRDGDVIKIEPYHEDGEAVRVFGPVAFPGTYPFRDGDRLTDLLRIAQGSADPGDLGTVRVSHRTDAGFDIEERDVAQVFAAEADDPFLRPGDFIRVSEQDRASAAAYGWVNHPGLYPIVTGHTTLTELVEAAGGLKSDADARFAYVDRNSPTLLKGTPQSDDVDFFDLAYLQRAQQARRIVVDVAAILRGDRDDFVLEHGDAVVFPRREETVYVIGNVGYPGFVPFVEGRTAGYYIEATGGAGRSTDEVYVVGPASGYTLSGRSAPVAAGATVYVGREEFADSPELQSLLISERTSRRQLRLTSTQTVISGISAVAAIITTVVAISR